MVGSSAPLPRGSVRNKTIGWRADVEESFNSQIRRFSSAMVHL
jgi:hypothetical protein